LAVGNSLTGKTSDTCESCMKFNDNWRLKMGRICVELSDELEKQLRFKTIEKFGGKKGDLTRAVEDAVKTWIAKEE
jgi:hypothetical protein